MIRKWVGEWLALSAPGGCATGPSVAGVAGVAGVLGIAGVRLHRHAVHPVSVFGYHGRRPQLCCVQLRASMPFTPKLPGNPPRNRPSPMRLEGGGGGSQRAALLGSIRIRMGSLETWLATTTKPKPEPETQSPMPNPNLDTPLLGSCAHRGTAPSGIPRGWCSNRGEEQDGWQREGGMFRKRTEEWTGGVTWQSSVSSRAKKSGGDVSP